jgi:putative membrane protein
VRTLLRWILAAAALFAAQYFIDGVTVAPDGAAGLGLSSPIATYAILALVLGLVMGLVKPILTLLTCPLQIMTLGLFSLVVNAVAFWLGSYVAQILGLGFQVDGFLPALLGSLVYSVITAVGGTMIEKDRS